MLDEITEAVLSREEIARYLEGSHGESGRAARASDRRLPRGAAHHAAVLDLPRAQASALPDPPQDRTHARAHRRARSAATRRRTRHLRVEPQEPHRLPRRAARARRKRRAAADHRRRDQPVRRTARSAPPPRDRRDPDPAQHEGPGVPDHAEGVRGGAAAQARPVLLSRRRPQLQRRDQDAEDRPDARGAAGGTPAPGGGADRGRLRPGARGPRAGAAARQADAAAVQPRAGRDGPLRRRLPVARLRHVRQADRRRRSTRRRAARCWTSPTP